MREGILIRVLHVDDERIILDLTKEFLEQQEQDFRVDTAISAEEALQKISENEYDAVVSDYKMPEMDGLEFLSELRKQGNEIPFIIFTGKGREEVAVEAFKRGANGYVLKGGTPSSQYAELAQSIRQSAIRKRAEEALRQSERRLLNIIENLGAGLAIFDENRVFTYVNPARAEMVGYTPEELIGKPLTQFLNEDSLAEIESIWMKRRSGETSTQETKLVTKDGRTVTVLAISQPLLDEQGEFRGSYSVTIDLTERKKMEEALRKSEEKYRSLVELAHNGIMLTEGLGPTISYANQGMAEMLGYTVEGLIGKSYVDLVHPEEKKEYLLHKKARRKSGKPLTHERRLIDKNGSTLYTLVSSCNVDPDLRTETAPVINIFTDITGRKRAGEALRESEERLRSILEAANDAILVSQGGRYVYANKKACEMFRYPEGELIGLPVEKLHTPDYRDVVLERAKARMQGKEIKPEIFEHVHLTKDGVEIPTEENQSTITWKGRNAGLIIQRDITERKRIEKELRESEERYRTIVEDSHEGIMFVTKDMEVRFANWRIHELLRYDEGELIDTDYLSLVPESEVEDITQRKPARRRGERDLLERRMVRKDGEEITLLLSISPHFNKENEYAGAHLFFTDITQRKRTEEALGESEKRYRTLVELAHDGIMLTTGPERTIAFANQKMADMLGYTVEELVGKNYRDFVHPDDREGYRTRRKSRLESGTADTRERRLVRRDGSTLYTILSVSSINPEDRTESAPAICIFTDISGLKRIEERERLLHSLLRHDLRNKLQGGYGYLELLNRTQLLEKQKEYVRNLKEICGTANELIDKIQALSTVEELAGETVRIDLNLAISDAIEDNSLKAEEQGIAVTYRGKTDTIVLANPLLKNAFSNLMNNSINHAECRKIKITVRELKDHYRVTFQDDGKGIPPSVSDKLFERGIKRVESMGSGLGLYLVKRIIDTSEGTIELKDTKKGTRFDIHLKKAET